MGCKCPLVGATRWLSLANVSLWIVKNRADVKEYLDLKNPAQAPDATWWILVHAFDEVMGIVNICFKSLQEKDTLITEQNTGMQNCVSELLQLIAASSFGTSGVYSLLQAASLETQLYRKGTRVVERMGMLAFIESLGFLVCNMFDKIYDIEQDIILQCIAELVLDLCFKMEGLVVLRDTRNAPNTAMCPPVLPSHLVRLKPRELFDLLSEQKDRLLFSFHSSELTRIEDAFKAFCREVNE